LQENKLNFKNSKLEIFKTFFRLEII